MRICLLWLVIILTVIEVEGQDSLSKKTDDKTDYKKVMCNINGSYYHQVFTNDSNIVNHSKLIVYKLFDNKNKNNKFNDNESMYIGLDAFYFKGVFLYKNPFFRFGSFRFHIFPTDLIINLNSDFDTYPGPFDKIRYKSYYRHQEYSKFGRLKTISKRKDVKTAFGRIKFNEYKGTFECSDTGRNPFKLETPTGIIEFNKIGNLIIFEYDVDGSGTKEIYIINFYSCDGRIGVYKISDK